MRPIGCGFEYPRSLNHAKEKSCELAPLDEELNIAAVALLAFFGSHGSIARLSKTAEAKLHVSSRERFSLASQL
jgi:hypothetical protein